MGSEEVTFEQSDAIHVLDSIPDQEYREYAKDFMSKLLKRNKAERITSFDALKHPFFRSTCKSEQQTPWSFSPHEITNVIHAAHAAVGPDSDSSAAREMVPQKHAFREQLTSLARHFNPAWKVNAIQRREVQQKEEAKAKRT